MKRVQLTSGDHGGKNTGGRAKGKDKRPPLSKAERQAQVQRQVETFRQNIRASEQRRKDRQSSGSAPAVEPQSTDGESASTGERLTYVYGVLLARVSSYGKAMDSGSWETLDEEAVKVAAAAAELEAATKMITEAAGIADDPPGG